MSDIKNLTIGTIIDEHKDREEINSIEVLSDASIVQNLGNMYCKTIIPGDVMVEAVKIAMNIISREEEKTCSD